MEQEAERRRQPQIKQEPESEEEEEEKQEKEEKREEPMEEEEEPEQKPCLKPTLRPISSAPSVSSASGNATPNTPGDESPCGIIIPHENSPDQQQPEEHRPKIGLSLKLGMLAFPSVLFTFIPNPLQILKFCLKEKINMCCLVGR